MLVAAASVAALTLPRADLGRAEGLGVLLALVAERCAARDIVAAAALGRRWPGPRGRAVALAAGAVVATPGGPASAWGDVDAPLLPAARAPACPAPRCRTRGSSRRRGASAAGLRDHDGGRAGRRDAWV